MPGEYGGGKVSWNINSHGKEQDNSVDISWNFPPDSLHKDEVLEHPGKRAESIIQFSEILNLENSRVTLNYSKEDPNRLMSISLDTDTSHFHLVSQEIIKDIDLSLKKDKPKNIKQYLQQIIPQLTGSYASIGSSVRNRMDYDIQMGNYVIPEDKKEE